MKPEVRFLTRFEIAFKKHIKMYLLSHAYLGLSQLVSGDALYIKTTLVLS